MTKDGIFPLVKNQFPSFIADFSFQIEFSKNIFPKYFLIIISYLCFQNNKKSFCIRIFLKYFIHDIF